MERSAPTSRTRRGAPRRATAERPPVDATVEPAADERVARRRFRGAAAGGGIVATPIFYWMVTAGHLSPFRAEPFGDLYDVQARSLLHLRWSVPSRLVAFEGFRVHGKTYLYFGPVPALLRLPVLAVTSSLDGRLTQVSMLAAFVVALCFVARLAWRVRVLLRGSGAVTRVEQWVIGAFVAVLGTGSVMLFLGSRALVYHEAELWGAALALAAYDAIVGVLVAPSRRSILLAGVWSTLAFLTRASVGAGPVVALGVVLGAALLRRAAETGRVTDRARRALTAPARLFAVPDDADRPGVLAGLSASVAVPVALYAYVNHARFGTWFSLPLQRQIYTQESAVRRHALAANGGSLFGLKFLPTQLLQVLRPDALRLQSLFPWVTFPKTAMVVGGVTFDTRDWSSSIPASMPLLTVLGLVGLVVVLRRRRRVGDGAALLRIPLLAAAAAGLSTLTIAYVANRYLSDFLPAVVLGSVVGLHQVLAWAQRRPRWRWPAVGVLVVLALVSVWVNFALAIGYQRLLFPATSAARAGFIGTQADVDHALPGGPRGHLHVGTQLPARGSLGELFAIGSCGGLYWSDSRAWFAIERGNEAGHFRLRVHFPAVAGPVGPEPLVSIGAPDGANVLFVTRPSPTRAQFLVETGGLLVRVSRTTTVHPRGRDDLDLVLDQRQQQARLTVNGMVVIDEPTALAPGLQSRIGVDLTSPGGSRFSGTVISQPVPTPLCDSLRRRYQVTSATG